MENLLKMIISQAAIDDAMERKEEIRIKWKSLMNLNEWIFLF